MKALYTAGKDLLILLKDRGTLAQLVLLPLIFIMVFSGAVGAVLESEDRDTRRPLSVVDLDGGAAAQTLREGLDAAGGVRVIMLDEASAMQRIDKGDLARALFIPAGFSTDLAAGKQVTLRLVSHPDAEETETEAMRVVIEGVTRDMALEHQILTSLQQMRQMAANEPDVQMALDPALAETQARSQFESSRERPLIKLEVRVPAQAVKSESDEVTPAQLAVPGFTVMFVFLTAQATARSIYDEKKVGTFRRLLAAPIPKATLLIGKMIPNVVASLVQTVVIFLFGLVGMRLMGLQPLSLGNDPLAVAVVALLIALCSSGLGILIAALAHTENQIGGLSSVLLWIMGFFGGSFVPVFLLERFVGPLMRVIPHYWANKAFDALLIRGATFADVVPQMAALLAFTAVFLLVGIWRFDFD